MQENSERWVGIGVRLPAPMPGRYICASAKKYKISSTLSCAALRPRLNLFYHFTQRLLCNFGIVGSLGAKPIAVGQAEKPADPEIRIRGDGTLPGNNLTDALGRNVNFLGQPVLTDSHGFKKFFQKDFARGYRFESVHTLLIPQGVMKVNPDFGCNEILTRLKFLNIILLFYSSQVRLL